MRKSIVKFLRNELNDSLNQFAITVVLTLSKISALSRLERGRVPTFCLFHVYYMLKRDLKRIYSIYFKNSTFYCGRNWT